MSAESSHSSIAPPSNEAADTAVAIRNGFRLAASLLATWAVALAVRFQVPRYLGPELFGRYNFCDAFTGGVFSFLSLGVGTYIMKEVATRPRHASEFFGGLLLLRAILATIALFLTPLALSFSSEAKGLTPLVVTFCVVYFVIGINGYLANLLQASTQVSALASVNVISKLIWGGGLLLALWWRAPLYVLALPNLAAELLRLVVLSAVARRVLKLRFRVDVGATKRVVVASLPFFANGIAVELGCRIDVSLLAFLAPGPEVGWYSAANNFASLALMVSPVIGWVVMPLLARARARSEEEFFSILRRSIRAVLVLALPGALIIALGADFLVELAFGSSFAPAVHAVRVLASMFVATYLAILLSVTLVVLQRSWTLTLVSFLSLAFEVVFALLAVFALRDLGDGGAASGVAVGLAAAEISTVILLIYAVGRRSVDAASLGSIGKCAIVAGGVLLLHRSLVGLGPWRLAIDLVAYALGVLLVRAIQLSELRALLGMLRERRGGVRGG